MRLTRGSRRLATLMSALRRATEPALFARRRRDLRMRRAWRALTIGVHPAPERGELAQLIVMAAVLWLAAFALPLIAGLIARGLAWGPWAGCALLAAAVVLAAWTLWITRGDA